MKRVLLSAVQANNRSGTGRYVSQLVNAFRLLPLPLDIVTANPRGGLDILLGHDPPTDSPLTKLLMEQAGVPLRSWRYHLTHFPAGMGPFLPCRRLILTVHDLIALKHPEWFTPTRARYYRNAAKKGVRRASRIVADSEATSRDLQELLHVPEQKIDVVPLGVSGNHFRPATDGELCQAQKELYLPQQYFLFMGTIEPRKNLKRILAAWRGIASEVPEDLVIAGRPGWGFTDTLEKCRAGEHATRIHLLGPVLDRHLPPLLSSATAFVWPSLYEGFGLPPLEAMACGAPVISSNTSSIPEVVGDAGILIDPTNEDEIAQAMLRVSKDAELRKRLSASSIARASQFTWQRTAELTATSYLRALA